MRRDRARGAALNAIARKDDFGPPGPAMQAIADPRHRRFVEHYVLETFYNRHKNHHGARVAAARKAG